MDCPYCKTTIELFDELKITGKRKIKRKGETVDSFPSVEFIEYGCPRCGGIFFDPSKVYEDIVQKRLLVSSRTISK